MSSNKTRYLTKVGILAAVAVMLMFFEVPVPMMPAFLKLDASELPAVVGALALGPLAGVAIELVKNLLHALQSQTMGIGELANFLVGTAFVVPVGLVYRYKSTWQGIVLGLTAGTLAMVAAASVLNYYMLLPLYQLVLHFPLDQLIAIGTAANPQIMDVGSFITLAIAPFNALKGMVVSLFTLLLYRKIAPILC